MKKSIIGHRGHPSCYHENTIKSFSSAVENGADFIEFDVRRTVDNYLIAFHDPGIMKNGILYPLSELTLSEIEKIAALQSFTVPLIEEIILTFSEQVFFDIELKEENCEHDIIELLNHYKINNDSFFTSFNPSIITNLKLIDPSIKTGFLFESEEMFPFCRKILVDYYCPEKTLYLKNKYFFTEAAKSGILSAVWTVDDPENIAFFLSDPSITAIITNKCDLAYKLNTL